MQSFLEFLAESKKKCKSGRRYLFRNPNMSFSEMRAGLNNLFSCNFSISNNLTEDDSENEKAIELNDEIMEIIKNNTVSAKEALQTIMEDLDKIASKIGYKATISDYVKEELIKRIVKCASANNIDINKKSLFVSELADRLNMFGTCKRPSKGDLGTFAKREGVSPTTPEYRKFITDLDEAVEVATTEITQPIETMLVNCAVLLSKVLQLPANIQQTNESKKFLKCCNKFYTDYATKKLEINDNAIGDVREFLTTICDYINMAKAHEKSTFKIGSKMYKLNTVLPNIESFRDIVEF
jgi:hypothetical protein